MGEVFCIAFAVIMIVMIIIICIVARNMSQPTVNYDQIRAQIQKENDKLEEFIAEQSMVSDEDDDEDDEDDDEEEE